MAGNDRITVLRAKWVFPVSSPPVENGAVEIAGSTVVGFGRFAEFSRAAPDAVIDLGEGILMPGLINAHCHLDYTMLRRVLAPPASFAAWIQRLNALKRSFADRDYLAAIGEGYAELVRTGTTAVANIGAFPHLVARLERPPVRTFWFHEMLDVRQAAPEIGSLPMEIGWAEAVGLSPHAPYTTSAELYLKASASGRPITTHLAESAEESQMFRESAGPLHAFLEGVGRPMSDCVGQSPVRLLLGAGRVPGDALLVHVNEVEEADFPLLAGRMIAHCPRSHRYFNHRRFQWGRLAALGATICLGTDSLASNDSLDLFAELRVARDSQPDLDDQAILEAATINAARALGRTGKIGEICPGAFADLILLPEPDSGTAPLAAVFGHRGPVRAMLVGGVPVEIPA
jgi:cytosine/adenosine deaminase-related metal-dependent hydrolase